MNNKHLIKLEPHLIRIRSQIEGWIGVYEYHKEVSRSLYDQNVAQGRIDFNKKVLDLFEKFEDDLYNLYGELNPDKKKETDWTQVALNRIDLNSLRNAKVRIEWVKRR